jgi:hypothetical protein
MYQASLNSGYVTITVIRIYRYIARRYFFCSIMDYIFLPALAVIAKHHLPTTTIVVLPVLDLVRLSDFSEYFERFWPLISCFGRLQGRFSYN